MIRSIISFFSGAAVGVLLSIAFSAQAQQVQATFSISSTSNSLLNESNLHSEVAADTAIVTNPTRTVIGVGRISATQGAVFFDAALNGSQTTALTARVALHDGTPTNLRDPAISDPSGGSVIDVEARTAITAILSTLRNKNLIK